MSTQIFRPQSTKKILVMFSSLFKDIKSDRITVDNSTTEDYNIPIYIESKNRLLMKYQKDDVTKVNLPAMSIAITSLDLDEERTKNARYKIYNMGQYTLMPVPYDWTVDLSILSERESELFSIVEQIVPLYQKKRMFPMIDFKFTDGNTIINDIPIELTSSAISIEMNEGATDNLNSYSCTIVFKISGWVYGSNGTILYGEPDKTNGNKESGWAGSGGAGLKQIQYIDINFENEIQKIYESMTVSENTGGDVEITVA